MSRPVVLIIGAFAFLMAQAAEGTIVDAIKREVEEASAEIVQRVMANTLGLQALMAQVKTESTAKNLNDLDGCSALFDNLDRGERLIKEAYDFGVDVVKSFANGTNDILKCGNIDFVQMGKCIVDDIKTMRNLVAVTKAGAASVEEDFKRLGGDIKRSWLLCIGKEPTTTGAPITTTPKSAPVVFTTIPPHVKP